MEENIDKNNVIDKKKDKNREVTRKALQEWKVFTKINDRILKIWKRRLRLKRMQRKN